jgi:hypothetical protein
LEIDILNMDYTVPGGVVKTLHWGASMTDGEYKSFVYGSMELSDKNPNDPTFIPFEQLTKDEVVSWVIGMLGGGISCLESNLIEQINSQKNPSVSNGVPWELV